MKNEIKNQKTTLLTARVNVGLSQEQASKKLGVSKRTLCNWENGITVPSINKIDAICELYGVHYDNLNFLSMAQ
ncbi:MAG: helix-turn-helix transcriptional regulator [Lachnospiraceae bacterium]|nr:helix-turn-helix transcriptional regulator [Lachnospiraceae bacterium]